MDELHGKEGVVMALEAIAEVGKAVLEAAAEAAKETGEKGTEIAKEVLGKGDSIFPDFFKDIKSEMPNNTFNDLDTLKKSLGKTYGEIKEVKPPNSPNIAKWFDNGGSLRIEEVYSKTEWTYIDGAGREVPYIDGFPKFPPEAKHSVIGDIDIGKFTGDRTSDKELYKAILQENYALTDIPEGYILHHDSNNGILQLVKTDWHKEFTHKGGHSMFKEV